MTQERYDSIASALHAGETIPPLINEEAAKYCAATGVRWFTHRIGRVDTWRISHLKPFMLPVSGWWTPAPISGMSSVQCSCQKTLLMGEAMLHFVSLERHLKLECSPSSTGTGAMGSGNQWFQRLSCALQGLAVQSVLQPEHLFARVKGRRSIVRSPPSRHALPRR